MRPVRLYVETSLQIGQHLTLSQEASHYLCHVLRLRLGTIITLFNGQGGEYSAQFVEIAKKKAVLQILTFEEVERESKLQLTLVQAISRPEHMDVTIQKAVELGVQNIVPVITERSPPLDKTKFSKREQRWYKIMISACEQCGRNRLPQLHPIVPLTVWLTQTQPKTKGLVLSPTAHHHLSTVIQSDWPIVILIGAEGGLTSSEISQAQQSGYLDIRLGPRILRTETAAVTILAICQALVGDLR